MSQKVVRAPNKAIIRVRYPDGCRASWETRPDAPLAHNAVKFARWLRDLAEQIEEAATTAGQCATKDTVAEGGDQ